MMGTVAKVIIHQTTVLDHTEFYAFITFPYIITMNTSKTVLRILDLTLPWLSVPNELLRSGTSTASFFWQKFEVADDQTYSIKSLRVNFIVWFLIALSRSIPEERLCAHYSIKEWRNKPGNGQYSSIWGTCLPLFIHFLWSSFDFALSFYLNRWHFPTHV